MSALTFPENFTYDEQRRAIAIFVAAESGICKTGTELTRVATTVLDYIETGDGRRRNT